MTVPVTGPDVYARLSELGLTLPAVVPPLAAYVPAVQSGNLVYVSGQLPIVDGNLLGAGRVGADVTVEYGAELARQCALNALAAVEALAGLGRVVKIVRITGYVACTPEFTQHPSVVNGASQLLLEVFGEQGRHARSAVGVASLPLGAPVEVELIAELG